jgi:hypothetical protein
VGVSRWLPVDGFEALHSDSYLSLVHDSLIIFDLAFWCFGTVLRNLTAYDLIGLTCGASQVPINAPKCPKHLVTVIVKVDSSLLINIIVSISKT